MSGEDTSAEDTSTSGAGASGRTSQSGPQAGRPRDAATLVIVDASGGEPRVLMGRRRATQVFMPNKVVFPGGRVDDADKIVPATDQLADIETEKVLLEMRGRPSARRVRALALAAVRETFEETGVIIGGAGNEATANAAVTDHATWLAFFAENFTPALGGLSLFARAITPPGRPRRYDTRFFCVSAEKIAAEARAIDDELRDVSWHRLSETAGLDIAPITRVILEDLADRLRAAPLGPHVASYPFYHHQRGTYRRDMLATQVTL